MKTLINIFNLLKKHTIQTAKIFNNSRAKINNGNLISQETLNIHKANTNKILKDYLSNKFCSKTKFINTEGIITDSPDLLFFPKLFPKNIGISGFMSLSDKERFLLTEKSTLGEEYRFVIKTIFSKTIFSFFSENHSSFVVLLRKAYENLFNNTSIKMSPELYKILGHRKLITLTQHMTSFIWYFVRVDYEIFKTFCSSEIDCTSFKDFYITIQSLTEVFFIKKNLLKNNQDNINIKIFLVNPEALHLLPNYALLESKRQTGQTNCDFICISLNNNEVIYIDVKTFSTFNFEKNQISLFHGSSHEYLKETNNIIISLKKYIDDHKIDNENPIMQIFKKITKIQKNTKITAKSKFEQILTIIQKMRFDPQYANIPISLSIALDADFSAFPLFYDNFLKEILKKNNNIALEQIFPKNNQMIKEEHEQIIKDFVEKSFPDNELKEIIWKNLDEYIFKGQITYE